MLKTLAPIKTPASKPAFQQLGEMINWGARLVTTPNDYKFHGLYRRGSGKDHALRYLSGPRAQPILSTLNPEPTILEHKLKFDTHFTALQLPTPPSVAVIGRADYSVDLPILDEPDAVTTFISSHLNQGEHLVVKDATGMQGAGVLVMVDVLPDEDHEMVILSNGDQKPLQAIAENLLMSSKAWLIQRRLDQHELLDSLNPSSLNTVRVGAFRNHDGSVEIEHAILRLGRSSAQIDGFNLGGLAVRIDAETGEFSEHGYQKPKYSLGPHTRHPDSGIEFAGRHVPYWDEVVRLCRKFTINSGANRFIGWDVAITPEGPVFVEGNHDWDVQFAQLGTSGMLTDEFIEHLHRETGIRLNTNELPKLDPLRALKLLMQ